MLLLHCFLDGALHFSAWWIVLFMGITFWIWNSAKSGKSKITSKCPEGRIEATPPEAMDLKHLEQSGKPATARILSISDTGRRTNGGLLMTIYFEVQDQDKVPFRIHTRTIVSRFLVPCAGELWQIKYNPDHPEEIIIIGLA